MLERLGGDNDRPMYREFFVDRLIVPELRGGHPIWCIGRSPEARPDKAGGGAPTAPVSPATPSGGRPRPKYLGLPGEKPVMGLELVVGRRAAFLVEGPFDLCAAVGWRLPAFAICGTHFPPDRLPVLAEALAIYGMYDPDRAGLSAAEGFAPLFGSSWRPVRLPNSLDLAKLAPLDLGVDGACVDRSDGRHLPAHIGRSGARHGAQRRVGAERRVERVRRHRAL